MPATELCHVRANQTLPSGQLADLPLCLVQRPDFRIPPVGTIAELDVPSQVPDSLHLKIGVVDHNLKAPSDMSVACGLSRQSSHSKKTIPIQRPSGAAHDASQPDPATGHSEAV